MNLLTIRSNGQAERTQAHSLRTQSGRYTQALPVENKEPGTLRIRGRVTVFAVKSDGPCIGRAGGENEVRLQRCKDTRHAVSVVSRTVKCLNGFFYGYALRVRTR